MMAIEISIARCSLLKEKLNIIITKSSKWVKWKEKGKIDENASWTMNDSNNKFARNSTQTQESKWREKKEEVLICIMYYGLFISIKV